MELISKLDCDPFFRDDPAKKAEVALALLTIQLHILIFFRRFLCFPTDIQGLCRAFNPATFQSACKEFVYSRQVDLDTGYALPLWKDAWSKGPAEEPMLAFLMSDEIQQDLEDLLWASDATTFDVERKHFADQKSERAGKNITSVPTSAISWV